MRLVKGLLARCVEVTELLAADGRARGVSGIAAALDLPKSAVHRLLAELCALGWVEQEASGDYRLTLRFAMLGAHAFRASGLPAVAQPILDRMAATAGELARLTVVTGDGLTWALVAQGARAGLVYQPRMDGAVMLHATANGKAYLATRDDRTAAVLARRSGLGRARPGPRTKVAVTALLAELAEVRACGHAVADNEAEAGVIAVAVAIRVAERTLGTLSLAGPELRFPPARIGDLARLLTQAAADLAVIWPQDALAPQPRDRSAG